MRRRLECPLLQLQLKLRSIPVDTNCKIMIPEMVIAHEGKEARAQAEIEINADANAVQRPAAIHENRAGRQRRPADITIVIGVTQTDQARAKSKPGTQTQPVAV